MKQPLKISKNAFVKSKKLPKNCFNAQFKNYLRKKYVK